MVSGCFLALLQLCHVGKKSSFLYSDHQHDDGAKQSEYQLMGDLGPVAALLTQRLRGFNGFR